MLSRPESTLCSLRCENNQRKNNKWAGDVAQSVECWPTMYKALDLVLSTS